MLEIKTKYGHCQFTWGILPREHWMDREWPEYQLAQAKIDYVSHPHLNSLPCNKSHVILLKPTEDMDAYFSEWAQTFMNLFNTYDSVIYPEIEKLRMRKRVSK